MFSMFRDTDQLDTVERQILEMLGGCHDAYGLATEALFGERAPSDIAEPLDSMDKDLNRTERAIRRELLVHGTVHGAEVDQGLMLTYMSVAKDLERIGDYCKDIWNLAQIGASFSGSEDHDELERHRARVSWLIDRTLEIFTTQDAEAVHEMIPGIREDLDHYEHHLIEFTNSSRPGTEAVPRALFYRYLERISAHLANALSSLVMPVDRIDFYKASKATIEPEDE